MLYASSGACFRCRRADGAISVWSGPCLQVYQDCCSKLRDSLCCKLWNSSPWFPASLMPHEVEEGMCWDLKSVFSVSPRCGQEFYVDVPGAHGLFEPALLTECHLDEFLWSTQCPLSKKQGRAMGSSWRSWAGLSIVWILYLLLAALWALQFAGACIRKMRILSSYLPQLYGFFFNFYYYDLF